MHIKSPQSSYKLGTCECTPSMRYIKFIKECIQNMGNNTRLIIHVNLQFATHLLVSQVNWELSQHIKYIYKSTIKVLKQAHMGVTLESCSIFNSYFFNSYIIVKLGAL